MLESLIAHYGLLAVFVGSAIEGETVAFLGGVFAHRQLMPFWSVAAAAATGSFCADQIFFFLGRRTSRWPRIRKRLSGQRAASVKDLLERHPTAFILSFRFLYGLRTISPIVIGLSGVPARTFLLLNALAASVWGIVIPAVGFFFSGLIEEMLGRLHLHAHLLLAIGIAILLGAGVTVLVRRRLAASPEKREAK
ncbi:membrane protein DedA, SNARE-associated domain [Rhizobium sp. RU20A]|uniref:DedA family protein n=1 Tax=Rhizobium sp. RU20A TaxID=1907412 RepID=UPI000956372A|nr:DedA family protein [Rhizobium sp. RU20A]SIR16261.1 membrane protein DedA, SNARE-associated domain [Rhizobium sp. RU20A]